MIGNVVTFWTTTKIESIFTRWRWQPFLFTQNYSILHVKKLFEETRTEVKYKKFTKIIVTEEVFFLARSIHNWQLFVAPHICARRIICGAQIKSMYLPQNLLRCNEKIILITWILRYHSYSNVIVIGEMNRKIDFKTLIHFIIYSIQFYKYNLKNWGKNINIII